MRDDDAGGGRVSLGLRERQAMGHVGLDGAQERLGRAAFEDLILALQTWRLTGQQ
jgi:hypothetical protein